MPQPPDQLSAGRYRIERVLGVGGMSVVLLAFDNRIKVVRAIKLLHKRFANNPQIRERFEREATAQASLRHQNILMVHDVVEDDVGTYLVMELAEGGSLADRIKAKGPFSPGEVIQIGITLCAALGAAHNDGVIHRDIKPENILVDRNGVLKIADFGIARIIQAQGSLTQTGMVMGTWAYMPPEQRQSSKEVDGRADIYALGATLFFLLTARKPNALHNSETHDKAYHDIPDDLARVIQKATRLYPEDRYQSCAEMSQDLQALHDGAEMEVTVLFQPTPASTQTLAASLEDLPDYLRDDPDVAETLATLLDPASKNPSLTMVPLGTDAPTPSLYLPPPDAQSIAQSTARSTAQSTEPAGAPSPAPAPVSATPPVVDHAASVARRRAPLVVLLALLTAAAVLLWLLPRLLAPTQGEPTTPVPVAAPVKAQPVPAQPVLAQPVPAQPVPAQPVPAKPVPAKPTGGTAPTSTHSPRIIQIGPATDSASGADTTAAPGTGSVTPTAPADPTGLVIVRTVPSGATVAERGRQLSRSGRGYLLDVGSHVLEIRSPDGEKTLIPIVVQRDQSVEICYSFDTNSACATD
ncbi:MAG: protein kinase [Oligoflexia bacterium]|nr:protein kinase [Oligoflexia bacterium]